MDREMMLKMLEEGYEPITVSVHKWRDIVYGDGEDDGINNCACCEKYYDDSCEGCPVYEKTGYMTCVHTPYEYLCNHMDEEHYDEGFDPDCSDCLHYAEEELRFLEDIDSKNRMDSFEEGYQAGYESALIDTGAKKKSKRR